MKTSSRPDETIEYLLAKVSKRNYRCNENMSAAYQEEIQVNTNSEFKIVFQDKPDDL